MKNTSSAEAATSPRSIGICFSCGVRSKNEKDVMAWDTKARVDKALMLYKLGFIDQILCTGGIFQKGQKQPISAVMMEYLEEQGVPKVALLTETQSLDTIENIKFALALLKKRGLFEGITSTEDLRIVVISERLHVRRIEVSLRAQLEQLGLHELIPIILEPVTYSISDLTLHTEEALLHETILDPLGTGELFQSRRRELRAEVAKTKSKSSKNTTLSKQKND